MNNREDLVRRLIKQEYNWVVGGWMNDLADNGNKLPSTKAIAEEIYYRVMKSQGVEVAGGIFPTKKDIRFLGSKRIKEMISTKIEREGELK